MNLFVTELCRATSPYFFSPSSSVMALASSLFAIRKHFQHGLHFLIAQAGEHCHVRVHGILDTRPIPAMAVRLHARPVQRQRSVFCQECHSLVWKIRTRSDQQVQGTQI